MTLRTITALLLLTSPALAADPPTVLITNGRLTIDRQRIGLPTTLKHLERVLGKNHRTDRESITWDRVGAFAFVNSKGQVYTVGFFFHHDGSDYAPGTSFRGSLTLDGVKMTSGSKVGAVARQKQGVRLTRALRGLWKYEGDRYAVHVQAGRRGVVFVSVELSPKLLDEE